MTEHLHELKPVDTSRSVYDAIAEALAKLDNEGFASPEERAYRFWVLLSLEGFGIYPSIPMPRAIR